MEHIGNIEVPVIAPSGTFPIISDFPHEVLRRPQVVVHQFGSGNAKIEQRFWLGNGARRYTVRKAHLNDTARIALLAFWEDHYGPYTSFTYWAPSDDGLTTTEIVARFENEPLSIKHLSDMISSVGITLVEIPNPANAPTYTWTATLTRFPDTDLKAALLAQVQTIVPLIKIQPREPNYPAIYVSDRRCTIDYGGGTTQLYLPRLLEWDGIGQSLDGASDDARFTFGNADRVMRALANQTDLNRAAIEFSLYHVGSGVKLNLWAGEITDFSIDAGPEFQVSATHGIYHLNLAYPCREICRDCWKDFNDSVNCPYGTEGSGGDPVFCDKGYATPAGCQSHGMKLRFGGIIAEVQGIPVKVPGSSGGRTRITATSIVDETIYDKVVPEIYCDSDMPVNALIATGRDESEFFAALGIVGEGPLGAYGSGAKLDDQLHHGPGALGLYENLGPDPAINTQFFGLDASGGYGAKGGDNYAAGTAFVMIRRSDSKGLQLSRPGDHKMQVIVSQGYKGWTWTDSGNHVTFNRSGSMVVLTNPIWIVVNMWLKALGLRNASSSVQCQQFDVKACADSTAVGGHPVGAALICDEVVTKLLPTGSTDTENQFKFRGILAEQKSLCDWIEEILVNCLGYWSVAFGKFRPGIRCNSSVIEAFTVGNIIFNSLQLRPVSPRFNRLDANFADEEFAFAGNLLRVYDIGHAKAIGTPTGPRFLKSTLNLTGAAGKSQVARIISIRLREELGGTVASEWKAARLLTFATTVLALAVEPGMVCSMTAADMPGGTGKFRVTGFRLNKDFSISLQGRSVTDSMYDLASGPKPSDVVASAVPVELGNDVRVPPAPVFGIESYGRDGRVNFGPPGFGSTDNWYTLNAISFFIRHIDEIAGVHTTISEAIDNSTDPVTKIVASTAGIGDHDYPWHGPYDAGHAYVAYDSVSYLGDFYYSILAGSGHLPTDTTYWLPLPRVDVAIDGEALRMIGRSTGASTLTLARAQLGSIIAAHNNGADLYLIYGRLESFGITRRDVLAGSWSKSVLLPSARVTSVQALVMNHFGESPITTNDYLIMNSDPWCDGFRYGIRTGRPSGELVLGPMNGPMQVVNPGFWLNIPFDLSFGRIYAWASAAGAGGSATLNVLHRRSVAGVDTTIQTIALTLAAGQAVSNVVSGASLLPALAGDWIEMDGLTAPSTPPTDVEVVLTP
jgi:hypothetical protein